MVQGFPRRTLGERGSSEDERMRGNRGIQSRAVPRLGKLSGVSHHPAGRILGARLSRASAGFRRPCASERLLEEERRPDRVWLTDLTLLCAGGAGAGADGGEVCG